MKNIEKVLDALVKAFPGHRLDILFNFNEKKYSIYLDEQYVGNFEEWFLRDDFDNPEIEIKIKAPKNKITAFVNNCNLYRDDIHEAVERGLKEWQEGSRQNS